MLLLTTVSLECFSIWTSDLLFIYLFPLFDLIHWMVTHRQDPDLTVILNEVRFLHRFICCLTRCQLHNITKPCYVACIPRTVERASMGKSGVGDQLFPWEQLFPLTYKGIYINIYQSINLWCNICLYWSQVLDSHTFFPRWERLQNGGGENTLNGQDNMRFGLSKVVVDSLRDIGNSLLAVFHLKAHLVGQTDWRSCRKHWQGTALGYLLTKLCAQLTRSKRTTFLLGKLTVCCVCSTIWCDYLSLICLCMRSVRLHCFVLDINQLS